MHEFWKKGFVVPDKYKVYRNFNDENEKEKDMTGKKEKKYAGGMVIKPKVKLLILI